MCGMEGSLEGGAAILSLLAWLQAVLHTVLRAMHSAFVF